MRKEKDRELGIAATLAESKLGYAFRAADTGWDGRIGEASNSSLSQRSLLWPPISLSRTELYGNKAAEMISVKEKLKKHDNQTVASGMISDTTGRKGILMAISSSGYRYQLCSAEGWEESNAGGTHKPN